MPKTASADRHRLRMLAVVWVGIVLIAIAVGAQLPGATGPDHRISVWLVEHRTPSWDKVTAVLSGFASTFSVMAIALIVIGLGLVWRRTAGIIFVVIAMAGEITMFLTITLVVNRSRPDVHRLDPAPPTSSFPSGHTLATFVMWNAVAVLAVRQNWSVVPRTIARFLGVAMPAAVGASRAYRGMHHATDVLAAFVIGLIWMLAMVAIVTPDAFAGPRDRDPSQPSADELTDASSG